MGEGSFFGSLVTGEVRFPSCVKYVIILQERKAMPKKNHWNEGKTLKRYELIMEMFNNCCGKPQTFFKEIQTDSLDQYMRDHLQPGAVCEQIQPDDGSIIYEVDCAGLRSKYTFTEI